EPVFSTRGVSMQDVRLVGKDGKHLKLSVGQSGVSLSAIAFSLGDLYRQLKSGKTVDIAYTVNLDTWNGNKRLQLKIKDIRFD
ncbi:single-stranded-DNA-specific exonuclease RecJ, partial [Candidatus Gottesmanbacteria bacterium]|nr:single-stranded-DNA-specific exonuclease RecJ [Candidatus Gottesmanbacteria bacterium]